MDEKISLIFQNLVVEAQPEYLINNPGEGNHNTTITFQLSSAQKKYCTATISIYSSAGQLVKQETLNNLICPGTYTYQWDGKMTQGTPPLSKVAPKGIYPYDVEVVGACPYDGDYRCSKSLKITQTKAEIVGGLDDCSSWDGSSPIPPLQPKVSYVLEDTTGKSAYSAKITVFDRQIQNLGEESDGTVTNLPGTINPIWNEKILGIELVPEGFPYTFLVSAIDDHPEVDKAHRRKTSLQRNQKQNRQKFKVVIDAGHGGNDSGTRGSMYRDMQTGLLYERYDWTERESNGWLSNSLITWLIFHNHHNKQFEYEWVEVDRTLTVESGRRQQEVRKLTSQGNKNVFLSLYCNSLGRPDSTPPTPNPTGTSNLVYYRYEERGDKDLANSITNALQGVREVRIGSDPRISRSNPINYKPVYHEPRSWPWAVLSWNKAEGCFYAGVLIECVTLTNYEDEDYVMPRTVSEIGGNGHIEIGRCIENGVCHFIVRNYLE